MSQARNVPAAEQSFYGTGQSRHLCSGDSGGPYLATFSNASAIVGIHVGAQKSGTNVCSSNGGREYAVRPGASRMDWIQGWISSDVGGT